MGISTILVALGGVLGVISVIMGALFIDAPDFVVAERGCNESDPDYDTSKDGFCDDFTVKPNGERCQIGNLGLQTASFTPECLDGTPYEIPALIARGSTSPTEFPPLFPAQTGLGGALQTLLQSTEEFEFEGCTEFFTDAADAPLRLALGVAAIPGIGDNFDAIRAGLKENFDNGVDDIILQIDGIFINGPVTVVNGALDTEQPGASLESLYSGTFGSSPAALDAFLGSLGPVFFTNGTAGEVGVINSIIQDSIDGVRTALSTITGSPASIETAIKQFFASGARLADLDANNVSIGVSNDGLWTGFNANLCLGSCTYIGHIQSLFNDLAAAIAGPAPDILDNEHPVVQQLFSGPFVQLNSLLDVVTGFEAQTAAGLLLSGVTITAGNRTHIETAFEQFHAGDTVATGEIASWQATIVAAAGNNLQLAVPGALGGLFKAPFVTTLKGQFNEADAIPPNFDAPGAAQENLEFFSLLCLGVGEEPTCNIRELFAAASALDPADADTANAAGLFNLVCATASNEADCTPFVQSIEPTLIAAASELLGAFYRFPEGATTYQAVLDSMIEQCEDDETDAKAISQAQVLVPGGVALIGLGVGAGLINLAVKTKSTKVVGVLSGVVTLVGAILIIVGLLGVLNAPVYQVLTQDGPITDESNAYENGAAFTLALGLIGAGIVGGLLLAIGGALSKPPENGMEIMGKPQ